MSELRKAAQMALDTWEASICAALRSALAQPERKPLTEKEIYALVDATLEHGRCALARAIERAHGIE